MILQVTPDTLLIEESHTGIVSVESNGRWKAKLSDSSAWTIDKAEGEGNGEIVITFSGAEIESESAELVIQSEDCPELSKHVTIIKSAMKLVHGKYIVLNKAKVGQGIDVVVMGEGFTQKDLEGGGRWKEACEIFTTTFFAYEPLKSYRDHFNVYAVAVPSQQDLWNLTEKLETDFATYDPNKWPGFAPKIADIYQYAYENTPVKQDKGTLKDLLVAFMINTNNSNFGGICQGNHIDQRPTWGMAMASIPVFIQAELWGVFGHELIGHGFGALHENYINQSYKDEEFTFNELFPKKWYQDHQRRGVELDTEFSNNPNEFINRNWAELYKMNYRNVDIIEGARLYGKGVWRSSQDNAMNAMGDMELYKYFSPVQREILLSRIYKYSGRGDEYSLSTFIDYDVVNEAHDKEIMKKYPKKD